VNSYQQRRSRKPLPPLQLYPLMGLAVAFQGLFLSPLSGWSATRHSGRSSVDSRVFAQDENGTDESDVATAEVDKYVAVYKAMQRDRSLTVEQAAAAQGMTLKAFRDLENRIERDDSAREHARDALRAAASPEASTGAPSPAPAKPSKP